MKKHLTIPMVMLGLPAAALPCQAEIYTLPDFTRTAGETSANAQHFDFVTNDGWSGTPTDAVQVKLKRSTLGATGKIFARLKVGVTPSVPVRDVSIAAVSPSRGDAVFRNHSRISNFKIHACLHAAPSSRRCSC